MTIRLPICTCRWSTVNTATIDPPHIIWRDPVCPKHGMTDEEYERHAEDEQRRDDAARGFEDE